MLLGDIDAAYRQGDQGDDRDQQQIDPRMTTLVTSHAMTIRFGIPAILAGLLAGCADHTPAAPPRGELDQPVVLIGVDGLEWRVMLPMIQAGELPAMARLMEQGTYGKLETILPTFSPIIWTSAATGKVPAKHGILHFVAQDSGPESRRLYTNRDRETKALWNIFSDLDRRVHSIGWWMTFPAEEVNGTMVAQTNTRAQISTERGKAIWKGSVVPGLEGQVYPPRYQARVMEIASNVGMMLPQISRQTFGDFKHAHTELTRRLWDNTQWAFRADTIYDRIGRDLLASEKQFDLMMIYFGGTDVVGHRFWRYKYPQEFRHQPTAEEIENFSNIIRDYYSYVDAIIGRLVAALPHSASIIIISDHGMHAANQSQEFTADLPPVNVNSAEHKDAPPGVIIAAGKFLRRGTEATPGQLPSIGSILDITPTILALKGLPIGRDMDGVVIASLFEPGFLDRHPPTYVQTHDTRAWLAGRPAHFLTSQMSAERIEQLKALGYLD